MQNIGSLANLRSLYLSRFCPITGEQSDNLRPGEATIERPGGSTMVVGGNISPKVRKGTKMADGSGVVISVTRKDIVVETIKDKQGILHNTTTKKGLMTPDKMVALREETRIEAEKDIDPKMQERAADAAFNRRHIFNIGPNGRRIIAKVGTFDQMQAVK